MTSMRRQYVASTSVRRHVPAGNLAPPWPPQYSKPSYAYAWYRVTKFNIAKLEQSTGACSKFCCSDYFRTSGVISMLQELDWQDFESRRDQYKVTMMYRIVNNLSRVQQMEDTINGCYIVPSTHIKDPFHQRSASGPDVINFFHAQLIRA